MSLKAHLGHNILSTFLKKLKVIYLGWKVKFVVCGQS